MEKAQQPKRDEKPLQGPSQGSRAIRVVVIIVAWVLFAWGVWALVTWKYDTPTYYAPYDDMPIDAGAEREQDFCPGGPC